MFSSRNSLVLSYERKDLLRLYIMISKLVKRQVGRLGWRGMRRCELRNSYIGRGRKGGARGVLGLLRGVMCEVGGLGEGRRVSWGQQWVGFGWV